MIEQPAQNGERNRRIRTRRRIVCICIALIAVLAAAAPSMIAHTHLRDLLINQLQDDPYLVTSTGSDSFGWFTSTKIRDVSMLSDDRRVNISAKQFASVSSFPRLWLDAPDIGTVKV